MTALGPSCMERPFHGLWSLWNMLQSYLPIYEIAMDLQRLRSEAEIRKNLSTLSDVMQEWHKKAFRTLCISMIQKCPNYGFCHTAELAKRVFSREVPTNYADMFSALAPLDDSLSYELENESVFRIPPERKDYFEKADLLGPQVGAAFPSCGPDARNAGSCYALGQAEACVHHLMLVLERGLNALATKVGVPYQRINWQVIIDQIGAKLKSLPRGPEREFFTEVNAQFGFLKDAYRNHAEHARDNPCDLDKARSIFNHVRDFMQELEKGGLSE